MGSQRSNPSDLRRNAAYLTAALALFFLFLDRLKDSRSSFWCPMTWQESLGTVLTFLVFWVLLACLVALVEALLRRSVFSGRNNSWLSLSLSGLVAGLAHWAFLSVFRARTPTLDDAVVVGTLMTMTVVTAALDWSGVIRFRNMCLVWSLAFLSGIAAQRAALDWFFFEHRRATLVTVLSASWMAAVLAVGMAVWTWTQRRSVAFVPRVLVGLLALAVPAGFKVAACPPLRGGWTEAPGDGGAHNLLLVTCDALREIGRAHV